MAFPPIIHMRPSQSSSNPNILPLFLRPNRMGDYAGRYMSNIMLVHERSLKGSPAAKMQVRVRK